jgi:hypothetical protein
MVEIVIYPNNDVTVDGEWQIWNDAKFRRFNIPMIRPSREPWSNNQTGREALIIIADDIKWIIFPTEIYHTCGSLIRLKNQRLRKREARSWKPTGCW